MFGIYVILVPKDSTQTNVIPGVYNLKRMKENWQILPNYRWNIVMHSQVFIKLNKKIAKFKQ